MEPHGFVELYSAKAIEYLIAGTYLLLFLPFWRWVQGSAVAPSAVRVSAPARRSWFDVPDGIGLHPGHAWALPVNGLMKVGVDDFAHHLVGPLTAVDLPVPGTELRQGRPAFSLVVGDTRVPVLSPADGMVTERNAAATARPGELHQDPYGAGWLFEMSPAEPAWSFKQLLSGEAARAYVESCASAMAQRFRPALGAVAADGGAPVHGFARELQPDGWESLAREVFLTSETGRN